MPEKTKKDPKGKKTSSKWKPKKPEPPRKRRTAKGQPKAMKRLK